MRHFRYSQGMSVVQQPTYDRARSGVFEAVLRVMQSPVVVLDPSGRIDWMDPAAEHFSGYGSDQLRGAVIWDVLIPDDQAASVREVLRSLAEGGPPIVSENDWLTNDGSRYSLIWSNTFVADSTGRVQWIVKTGTDVSAVRCAEQELRRSELRAKALLDTAVGGILAVDQSGVIRFANPE